MNNHQLIPHPIHTNYFINRYEEIYHALGDVKVRLKPLVDEDLELYIPVTVRSANGKESPTRLYVREFKKTVFKKV